MSTNTAVAPRIYGLPKIHKEGNPLRPICSSINSPTYELSKYIVDILKHLTKDSSYNIKDALDLKDRIKEVKIEEDEILLSFDVVSLFPSIPIHLALKTITEKWDIIKTHTQIPKDLFIEILTLCIKESRYFMYDDKVYEQKKRTSYGISGVTDYCGYRNGGVIGRYNGKNDDKAKNID